jgi:hypothetical protein
MQDDYARMTVYLCVREMQCAHTRMTDYVFVRQMQRAYTQYLVRNPHRVPLLLTTAK